MPPPYPNRSNETASSEIYQQFTFAATAIDLTSCIGAPTGLNCPTRRIKFNADGALSLTRRDGMIVVLLGRKAGEIEDVAAVAVNVTGTTAALAFTCYW